MRVQDYIFEAASKCDDLEFRDFSMSEYRHELYRAIRGLVKDLDVTERVYQAELVPSDGEISLSLPGFFEDNRVFVNSVEYHIVDRIDETKPDRQYYLRKVDGVQYFNFSPRPERATVTIYYKVYPEADTIEDDKKLDILPAISSVYEEELLSMMISGLAMIGMARFKEDKLYKYQRILKLYTKRINPTEKQKSDWVQIKPYTVI